MATILLIMILSDQHWVSRMDSTKDIIVKFNLKDNLIRKFYKTHDGRIWLATGKFGLGKWEKNPAPKVDHLCNNPSNESSISNDNVYDISEDQKNNLWVSTFGGGLNYFNTVSNNFEHIAATSNLSEGIQIDAQQNVWIISNGNLYKYNPSTKTNTTFMLPDLEKSGGVRGNIYKDDHNNLYVAGTNYFIEFNPSTVKEEFKQPEVYFTDFKIFNNSFSDLLFRKNIELRYFQNYFTIEFSAPEFTGNSVEYSYKLKGFEDEWTDVGNRNFANYSNLPGGDYTFEVRATNRKGNWSMNITSLNINIIPPFWKQWWFFALCAVAIAGGDIHIIPLSYQ